MNLIMRAVVQRVKKARVRIPGRGWGISARMLTFTDRILFDSKQRGKIAKGLLVYLSVANGDKEGDGESIADKLVNLRIFKDEVGKMNKSVLDVNGGILVVSNFTLLGDCRRGRRPGFDQAAKPEMANRLYEKVCSLIEAKGVNVQKGVFGEYMEVESVNDGPVNFLLDSTRLF